MEHFSRFRRNRKDAAAAAAAATAASSITVAEPNAPLELTPSVGKTTPPPGDRPAPQRPSQKLGAFLRPSGKRARSSPPAALQVPATPVPATPVPAHDAAIDHPPTPVLPKPKKEPDAKVPRLPGFLNLSRQEIESKFLEIGWLERNRLMESIQNPSADFRWARPPSTRRLDRYANIQPWANHRVKLNVPDGQLDYINASPIALPPTSPLSSRPVDRYIAMQGPNYASTDHTWRMVVEQLPNPGVIVMLTETHEGNFEKCFQYFPRRTDDPPLQVNDHDEFGDGFRASVRCAAIEETSAGAAIELRKLIVRVNKSGKSVAGSNESDPLTPPQTEDGDSIMLSPGRLDTSKQDPAAGTTATNLDKAATTDLSSEANGASHTNPIGRASGVSEAKKDEVDERIVWHFLFKKWPDFGVPALEDLDSFFALMRLSREKNAAHPESPRIVHCSAGVGRSGTFIALEHLMQELQEGVLEDYDNRSALAVTSGAPGAPPRTEAAAVEPAGVPAANGTQQAALAAAQALLQPQSQDGAEDDDPIFNVVNQLREQRRSMVQAEAQYMFIYQVMRKLWQDKYGAGGDEDEEPAAKRLEVDPFVEEAAAAAAGGG